MPSEGISLKALPRKRKQTGIWISEVGNEWNTSIFNGLDCILKTGQIHCNVHLDFSH